MSYNLLIVKEYPNKDVLFGDIIHTRKNNMEGDIDILATYNLTDEDRKPELYIVTYELNDTEGGDGDMRADAGETINLYTTLRNAWGEVNNVRMWLTVGENEDETIVEFLDPEQVDFGQNLSGYAKAKSVNPIRFKVRDNCVDGRRIKFVLHVTCDNISEELAQDFTITVENGVEIGGVVKEDMTLHAGVHYIVTGLVGVPNGVTLTIEPGVTLKFKPGTGLNNGGTIVANGTSENRITFTSADLDSYGSVSIFLNSSTLNYGVVEGMSFNAFSINGRFNNTVFRNNHLKTYTFHNATLENSSVYHNDFKGSPVNFDLENTNMISNVYDSSDIIGDFTSDRLVIAKNNIVGNFEVTKNSIVTAISMSDEVSILDFKSYPGTSSKEIASKYIFDINDDVGYSEFDLSNMLTQPNSEAPGIVWKVLVNGYDAQDEFEMLPPLGVGKHKFEVYYSKPVSKDFTPTIAMGVRPPYNSISIAEDGSWNEAGDIYTAYLTITGKMANDGLNRISVEGGEDLEHFEIPIENTRFNVMIQAAGSMSSGFMGEAGLGKVNLTWEEQTEEDVDDILGYNMYRYQMQGDTLALDTIRLNERMIDSDVTEFVDYDVKPGETYYYYYKIMRTSLTENSPSKTVAVTPLTASKGDANGSMTVDVADVVTEIGYLTNQNPQPFIFEAADVNSDLAVNILDVVGTINIILTPAENTISSVNDESAVFTVENGILYVDTPTDLGGLQFTINAPAGTEFTPLAALTGFEHASQMTAENQFTYLVYSMSGKTLKAGRHALLEIGEAEVEDVVLSDVRGRNVVALRGDATGISAVEKIQMNVPSPNPFREQVTIPYMIGKSGNHEVKLAFSDISGRLIDSYTTTADYGNYSYTWKPNQKLTDGIYLVTLYVDGKLVQTSKLVHIE